MRTETSSAPGSSRESTVDAMAHVVLVRTTAAPDTRLASPSTEGSLIRTEVRIHVGHVGNDHHGVCAGLTDSPFATGVTTHSTTSSTVDCAGSRVSPEPTATPPTNHSVR